MDPRITENTHPLRRLPSLLAAAGLALAALMLLAASVQAAGRRAPAFVFVFPVTSALDAPDNGFGDGFCKSTLPGQPCTLRAAIQELNHQPLGGGIQVPPGVYTLTDTAGNDLQIAKDMAIASTGPGLAVVQGKPGWGYRIFRVTSGANVILSGLAISGGHPAAGFNGGGLDVVSGTVLLVDALVVNNQAGNGGGIANSSRLIVDRSTIRQNGAITSGGGIYSVPPVSGSAYLTMTLTLIDDNISGNYGGGLYNEGHASILTSTFNLNEAQDGGGVMSLMTATLSIAGSALLNNQAIGGNGGGLDSGDNSAVAQLVNTTISGNSASGAAGGVEGFGGIMQLFNVTVVSNTGNTAHLAPSGAGGGLFGGPGTFEVRNSIIAHNTDQLGLAPDCYGTFGPVAYDLVLDTTGCGSAFGSGPGDITGTDPLLLPLGKYGGPTTLYGLAFNSPAVDAGDPSGCHFGIALLTIDQRGQPRKTDGNGDGLARCDLGAFELQLLRQFLPVILR